MGFLFWVWTVVACPLIGFLSGTLPFREDPGLTVTILATFGLPAMLAVAGGVATRRSPAQLAVAAVVATLLAGVWVFYYVASLPFENT